MEKYHDDLPSPMQYEHIAWGRECRAVDTTDAYDTYDYHQETKNMNQDEMDEMFDSIVEEMTATIDDVGLLTMEESAELWEMIASYAQDRANCLRRELQNQVDGGEGVPNREDDRDGGYV